MKNIEIDWKWTAIALAAVIGVGYISAQASQPKTTVVTSPVATPTAVNATENEEAEFQANFMDGCMEGDLSKQSYCTCGWDYLREHYTMKEIIKIGLEIESNPDEIPEVMYDTAYACVDHL